jgi:metal-responsive CopG/Arc/MetJ family transcriptional regulator
LGFLDKNGLQIMNTQRIAITMPANLVTMIDDISKKRGMSRSKYISAVLREKVSAEKERQLREAYDRVFSDESISEEQLETALCFEGVGSKAGQEW